MPGKDVESITSLPAAADRIAALAREHAESGTERPFIVGICGGVGSGKTTLASLISTCVISTDQYLPDYSIVPKDRRDDPAEADLERLALDLQRLRNGERTHVPEWSFFEHKRTGERLIEPAPVVVCEGLFALEALAHQHQHVSVFLEVPAMLRWDRAERREQESPRGWPVPELKVHFETVAEPTFARSASAYKARADIVVFNV